MKKAYQKPSITVVNVQMTKILCVSGEVNNVQGNANFGFRSTGFADDEDDY